MCLYHSTIVLKTFTQPVIDFISMSIIQKIKAYLLCAAALVSVSVSAEEIQFEGVRYDINKKNKQAQVLKVSNEESGSLISIPKFVEHIGELYLVTSIANNAFANSNLSCISIPSCVTMVGKRAFADCTNLEKIFCFATTPPIAPLAPRSASNATSAAWPCYTTPTMATSVPYTSSARN